MIFREQLLNASAKSFYKVESNSLFTCITGKINMNKSLDFSRFSPENPENAELYKIVTCASNSNYFCSLFRKKTMAKKIIALICILKAAKSFRLSRTNMYCS